MKDIKEIADDFRSDTIFILTELEDDNFKREMFAKSKQDTYEFNIQSNGGGVKEEIKERIVIEQCIRINISENKIDEMIDTLRYDLAILPGWSDYDIESMSVEEIETTDYSTYKIKMFVMLSNEEHNQDIYVYYQVDKEKGKMNEIYYENNASVETVIEEIIYDDWI